MTAETETLTLTEFLIARIAEDEAVARSATDGPWTYLPADENDDGAVAGVAEQFVALTSYDTLSTTTANSNNDGAHIVRHDPARVLAECEAKRRIVGIYHTVYMSEPDEDYPSVPLGGSGPETYYEALQHLAAVYSDHPDYDEAWR